jgi:dihydroflavonol-4-reductase
MNILIIGATGQIGRALVDHLASSDHNVSVLVRSGGDPKFSSKVDVIERPVFTPDVFADALRGADHVIYGVGLPEQFQFDTSIFERVNGQLLTTFLDVLADSEVSSWTYISTYEVFEVEGGEITEAHPIADECAMTPYFQSMVRAYRRVVEFGKIHSIVTTTIHPAAVYGGINTGDGLTDYMEKLAAWDWRRLPFINSGEFPIVHVQSLARAIISSVGVPGAFIVSDQMTTLKDIAVTLRTQGRSYVPAVMPMWVIKPGIAVLEGVARLVNVRPIASSVQIDYMTKGWEPRSAKARRDLDWRPMALADGLQRFLMSRQALPRGGDLLGRAVGALANPGASTRLAKLQILTASGLLIYWLLFYTIGLAPENPPPGYFEFQRSFTFPDIMLALAFIRVGLSQLSVDATARERCRPLTTVCAGAMLFLGGLDISFNVQNSIYLTLSIDTILEIGINVWCIVFGWLLIADQRRATASLPGGTEWARGAMPTT